MTHVISWLSAHREEIPLLFFTAGSVGLAVIVSVRFSKKQKKTEIAFHIQVFMNTILFGRILSVDFSGMFRSASFAPRDTNNTKFEKNAGEGLGNYLKNVLQEEDKSGNVKLAQE